MILDVIKLVELELYVAWYIKILITIRSVADRVPDDCWRFRRIHGDSNRLQDLF
jgi:hypothetical protein